MYVDHTVQQLLAQRIYGLALGYEDLNDHEWLRLDPLLATACEKRDPTGQDRFNPAHRGVALAGASTLNRLELSNNKQTRAHKLAHDPGQIEACLLQMGVRCLPKHAEEIVLDLDAMGHRLHGMQEGRHYRAHYDEYCYLPLYVFAGDYPLWAQLRTSDKDGADGVVAALEKIVAAIRKRCRRARIIVRGDSGFCREEILAWCEGQAEVYYCLGFAKNSALVEHLGPALAEAQRRWCLCGGNPVREFAEFAYQTRQELEPGAPGHRQSGSDRARSQSAIYRDQPARPWFSRRRRSRPGLRPPDSMKNFIVRVARWKMCSSNKRLDLRADRMSTHYLASNQLRLWLAAFAYLLLERLRTWGWPERNWPKPPSAVCGSSC